MKSLTRTTMSFIAYALTALLCFAQVGGCSLEKAPEKVKLDITFELPAPWEVKREERSAFLWQPAHSGDAGFAKISVGAVKHSTTEETAYQEALKDKEETGKLSEQTIAETTVYMLDGEAKGDFSGVYSNLYFIRDGWLVWAVIYDGYEHHKDAAEELVRTLHVKELN